MDFTYVILTLHSLQGSYNEATDALVAWILEDSVAEDWATEIEEEIPFDGNFVFSYIYPNTAFVPTETLPTKEEIKEEVRKIVESQDGEDEDDDQESHYDDTEDWGEVSL